MGRRPAPVTGEPVRPHPAATVVLLRPGADGLEVLLTRRPSTMAFAAGMMVFPGGRVDAADSDPGLAARSALTPAAAAERLGGGAEPELAAALHVAAVRELFEEAGILLADVGGGGRRRGGDRRRRAPTRPRCGPTSSPGGSRSPRSPTGWTCASGRTSSCPSPGG